MTGGHGVLVATPLGRLYVWATSLTAVHAATLTADQKTRPPYRDDPAAQQTTEAVQIDTTACPLSLMLRRPPRVTDVDPEFTRHDWVLDYTSLHLGPLHAHRQSVSPKAAYHAGKLLLPPLADWLVLQRDFVIAGRGVIGAAERPPLIIRCCEDNQRSDGGRRPQHRPHPLAGRP